SDFTTPQSGFTVETIDSSSFTITFTSPTQSSSALYKLTIESSDTSPNPTASPSESASSSPSGSPTGSGSATPCAPGIVNGTGDGLTISTPGTSAYQILQDYPTSSSGLKWISLADVSCGMPFQIYADMDRDGGGWTLIFANSTNFWTLDQVNLINSISAPSDPTDLTGLGGKYSILSYADYIKKSTSGFQYRLEAGTYGASGGVWTVNQPYSFLSTSSANTDITLDTTFGSWVYSNDAIEERMPYLIDSPDALLTTSTDPSSWWWGTLAQAGSWDSGPGPWMELFDARPAILWYWVR
ncbi:MAG: fibrinogen-like YCDxxxxGGGW domain-containing protein, partial [Actinobacteria bacterium]|nr:fibrinogen-like YCDxxxxGGGW domain-containing protein [Actinomycetota bacterium]